MTQRHAIRVEKKEEKRRQIISAAEELIREENSSEFSMLDLSKRCNLSIATIYNLMVSKPTILFSLLNRSLDRLFEAAPARESDAIQAAIKASEIATEIFTSDPDLLKPLYRYLLGLFDPVHVPELRDRALSFWMSHFEGLEERGLLPEGLGLMEFARDHQIFFAGVLVVWAQEEIDDRTFCAQVRHGGIVRLLAVTDDDHRAALLEMLKELSADLLPAIRR